MSAISFAKQASKAFTREKPHSSITDWVDILTGPGYKDEDYDGLPELVDSINLQSQGPAEASRAIRKKIKHGDTHHQYRSLVILKVLVENSGHKFQTTFADGQLTDALKHLATDPTTDPKVKRKLLAVLASWHEQFKTDPSMSMVANLYKQYKPAAPAAPPREIDFLRPDPEYERKRLEKEEAKKRAKKEKEDARERERLEEEERRKAREKNKNKSKTKRPPFDFEKEKPQVLSSIANASQASSNLVNAITLVNQEKDSLQTNERVQECLMKAKQARKLVVRYIQLVENEELIGTLIETNERIIAAMEMYDKLSAPHPESHADLTQAVEAGLAAAHITMPESEVTKLQERQRAAIEKAKMGSIRGKQRAAPQQEGLYADLQDLSFGPLGASSNNLPAPIQPSGRSDDGTDDNQPWRSRGSLSDYSDYESSDEETHNAATSTGGRRARDYVDVSDDPEDEGVGLRGGAGQGAKSGELIDLEDPFADPFADEAAIGPAKKW